MLHGSRKRHSDPAGFRRLCDTDKLRASKLQHAIRRTDGNANFSRSASIRTRPQCVPDPPFVSADIGLNQRTPVAAGGLLPGHTAARAGIERRDLLAGMAALPTLAGLVGAAAVQAQTITRLPPLASWNDGPAKQAILDFVRNTTDPSSSVFVPPEQRIATFDQDGTLWVEHPIYTQVVYCLDRVPDVVKTKTELAKVQPFKTVMPGDFEAIAKLSPRDLEEIAAATLTGMDVDAFESEAQAWIETAKDHRWKRPYTALTYQPMQEVLLFFRANGYKTFIVTGRHRCGREIRLRPRRQADPGQAAKAQAHGSPLSGVSPISSAIVML